MSQSLSAESESFFAYLTTVLFITNNMYPLVRVCIPFVLIFVVAKITVEPNTTFLLLNMPVEVANMFEASVTVLFHTL